MPLFGINMTDVRRVFLVDDDVQARNSPESPSTSLSQPAQWLTSLFAGPTASGVAVNQETALSIAAVRAAVRVLSEGVAGLQGEVIKQSKDGTKTRLPRHRVARQLAEPSPLYTGFGFKETLITFAALRGNGVARILPNGRFEIVDPGTVKVSYDGGVLAYTYTDYRGNERTVDASEVLHIPALALEPGSPMGKSPIQVHREQLGLAIAQTRYAAKFFKNGAHIDGFLSTDQKLSAEGIQRMAKILSKL